MPNFTKLRIRSRLILAFALVLLIPTVTIGAYSTSASSNALIEAARVGEQKLIETEARELGDRIGFGTGDLLSLVQAPAIARYIDAMSTNTAERTEITERVTTLFSSFLKGSSGDYKDLRIIDIHGQEILRVDNTSGTPIIIPASELENKADRPYYKATILLTPGQVYISGLDLNVTRGSIDVPYLPVIRYGTPLFYDNGTVAGVLILKAFANKIISDVVQPDDLAEKIILLDSDGSYIYHPDASKLYGKVLKNGISLDKDQPNDAAIIRAQSGGILFGSQDMPGVFQAFAIVAPGHQNSIHWVLLTQEPIANITAPIDNARLVNFLIALGALLIAVVVAQRVTAAIARPLNQLADTATAIGQGQWDAPIPVFNSADEFGKLSTAFRIMIAELTKANEGLQRRAVEQQRLLKELEETVMFKDQFLATMSHELRTPLNAILGFSGIAMMREDLPEEVSHMLERIKTNSRRLLGLINDILDISRINAGRVEIVSRQVVLPVLVRSWYDDMRQQVEDKGLSFALRVDPALPEMVMADEERLTQITTNLLGNALKFTDKGGITLSTERTETGWTITVTDTGLGISETWQHLIFDEFRQVDGSSRRKYGGAGLGLSIVKKLCMLMGGTVTVASKLGEGSTFTVKLPLTIPEAISQAV